MKLNRSVHLYVTLVILVVFYAMTSVGVVFIRIPAMLREADTAVNICAILLLLVWLVLTFYGVRLVRSFLKPVKKGNRRK